MADTVIRDLPQLIEAEFGEKLRAIRSHLHRNPEIAWKEVDTTAFIRRELTDMGLEPMDLGIGSGTAALLQGGHPGKLLVLRADIDALPVEEGTGAEDASQRPGMMHACGHDIHVTGLLGAAMALCRVKEELHGDILFLFQPAEESASGAEKLIGSGFFDTWKPDGFLGLHVWPLLPFGKIGLRKGAVLSAKDSFHITIRGRGGHGSAPHLAVDPIPAACALVGSLQTVVSRNVPALEPVVVSVCSIHGGAVGNDNVIPNDCSMVGSIRSFDPQVRQTVLDRITALVHSTAAAYGCEANLQLASNAPAVVNHPTMCRTMEASTRALFGDEGFVIPDPVAISEDFALYGAVAPSCLALFGVGEPGQPPQALHHPAFYPQSRVLPHAAAFLADSAIRFLNEE